MSYTNAIFYIDLVSGSDAVRTTLSSCTASNPLGSITRITKTGHGLVTGAVVTLSGFTAWLNGAWKITWVDADNFDLDGAVWQATADATGDCVPFGGSSWTDAWLTIGGGITTSRTKNGDEVRVSKTPDPVSCGQASFTNASRTVTIQALTSCTFTDSGAMKVRVTKTDHNLQTGNVVVVSATEGGTYDGTYIITYVSSSTFDLDGTTYSADKTGTCTPAFTKTICQCEANWTPVNATSSAKLAVATDAKEGSYCVKIVEDGTPSADQVQAYFATGALDLSKYQKISFWIKPEVAITANQLELNLCTGADGTGEVDTFPIPAIAAAKWCVLTIARNGGGNLNAGINSINISNGSAGTTYTASKYIYLDNIIATTTSGLNLQSLISKNSAAQGGTESFYGIQSIVDSTIILDAHTGNKANATRFGYYVGTTEVSKMYFREGYKSFTNTTNNTGNNTSIITIEGGYDTTSGEQNGETYFDGLNCSGNGMSFYTAYHQIYTKINLLSFYRYSQGVTSGNFGSKLLINKIPNIGNCEYGVYLNYAHNWYVEEITNIANCQYPVYLNNYSTGNIFKKIRNITNAVNNAINIYGYCNEFYDVVVKYSGAFAVYISGANNTFVKLETSDNTTGAVQLYYNGINYFKNCTLGESLEFHNVGHASAYYGGKEYVYSLNHDNNEGNNWLYAGNYNANILWQTIVYHGTEPGAWRCSMYYGINHSPTVNIPSSIKICEIALEASKEATVTCWVKKSNATYPQAKLIVRENDYYEIIETYHTKADDTDWENLSISFTPTKSCVIPIFIDAYLAGGIYYNTYYVYIGSVSVTQAE